MYNNLLCLLFLSFKHHFVLSLKYYVLGQCSQIYSQHAICKHWLIYASNRSCKKSRIIATKHNIKPSSSGKALQKKKCQGEINQHESQTVLDPSHALVRPIAYDLNYEERKSVITKLFCAALTQSECIKPSVLYALLAVNLHILG